MAVERLDPRIHHGLEALDHYARYIFASQFVAGRRTLDVACGLGYGAKILADAGASLVVAVDYSEAAIAEAKLKYTAEQIHYQCADANTLGSEIGESFDVVVSFETIEHLENPDLFLDQCRYLAHDETLFVLSVPNEAHLPPGFNPFHLQAFDREGFATLLGRHFASFDIMPQYFSSASVVDWSSLSESQPLNLAQGMIARSQQMPSLPVTYVAVCGPRAPLSALKSLVHGPRLYADSVKWTTELTEQHQRWIRIADEREAEARATQEAIDKQRQWVGALERGKVWLEGQWRIWEAEARKRQQTIEEQRQWIRELEQVKAWLEAQRQSWQTEAQNRQEAIEKQRHWIGELEQGKAWLEGQWRYWEGEAANRQKIIDENRRRISELDQAKVDLNAQVRSLETEARRLRELAVAWQAVVTRWRMNRWVRIGRWLGLVSSPAASERPPGEAGTPFWPG